MSKGIIKMVMYVVSVTSYLLMLKLFCKKKICEKKIPKQIDFDLFVHNDYNLSNEIVHYVSFSQII